jgi:RimJ/RimL family protein N-acetyltransferase
MKLLEFIDLHLPALERDQVRHNLIIGLLSRAREQHDESLMLWTLGPPGACAIKTPGRSILLGALDESQCRRLAEQTADIDYPGVIGPDQRALQFMARAKELGLRFEGSINQGISVLTKLPIRPKVSGKPRNVDAADASLFASWGMEFAKEATPHDPLPSRESLEARASEGRHWFWTVDDEPVSLAGIVRLTRDAAAIAPVYTPPSHRNRGFAGAVVSAVVDEIFTRGRTTACLYTDLANPAANRCYEKIGFERVCTASVQFRAHDQHRSHSEIG